MKKTEKYQPNIIDILIAACLIYSPFSFLINFICSVSVMVDTMLNLWASALIFVLSFVVALIAVFKVKAPFKNRPVKYAVCLYTALSFAVCAVNAIIYDGGMWNLYGLLLIVAYSVIVAIMMSFVKIKNFLITTLLYYVISLSAFMVLTNVIADYGEGNGAMILFGSFTAVYAVIAVIYFFIKRSFAQFENEEKAYKRQFD